MPPLDRQVKVCILYEYKLGNAADLAFLNVNRAFGDGTVTNATVHRWFSQFQDGEESLDREPTAELEYGEDGIEEDPVIVEALLARQFGLEPGTLHMHLDVLGRGEKLKEARDAQQRPSSDGVFPGESDDCLLKLNEPTTSAEEILAKNYGTSTPGASGGSEVKVELPDDYREGITVSDLLDAQLQNGARSQSSADTSPTHNGRSAESNKVRIGDNGLEFRSTLESSMNRGHPRVDAAHSSLSTPEARKFTPRAGGGVIARSLACLAKYRAQRPEPVPVSRAVVEALKPPPMAEASSDPSTAVKAEYEEEPVEERNGGTEEEAHFETVQLSSEAMEMKEHIVPLF